MAQLVNKDIHLINTMNNVLMDPAGVAEKFGVRPNQIVDYLALMGDKSDNIPGVPKVGPKTAVKWLAQFDSAQGVIENADSVGGKVGESLRDNIDMLLLSKALTTIKTDLDFSDDPVPLTPGEMDNNELRVLFSEFGFKSLLKK